MDNVLDIFEARGFVEQVTDREAVWELLQEPTTCYIGFDPTARSLHVGSLLPIMSLVHMQRSGHRPIAVVGGGTGLVGDPSGKTETRPVMTLEEIANNAESLQKQLARFIDFSEEKAIMVNNADWLTSLNYIEFLRDIGRHFSVNRMLTAESCRARLETGLSFIEFNYMLLQAYDFWYLFKHYDCRIQMGGNDQWGNILAGADLTRRLEGKTIHGLTFPLLTTSSGTKMGKTHEGTVWLDAEMTSPYDYYQYWINQDDNDVPRFLSLFTLLPLEEVWRLGELRGEDIRKAKEVLAFEATKLCHGQEEAEQAREASRNLFSAGESMASETAPTCIISRQELDEGIPAYILFEKARLCRTRSEARRLISQGGGYVDGKRIQDFEQIISSKDMSDASLLLRAGKKRYMNVTSG
jgi:tyrosyl-tRNA synthetase